MTEGQRERAKAYAERYIAKDGSAVCVCGQMFLKAEEYVEHVADCQHIGRQRGAQGRVDFERD